MFDRKEQLSQTGNLWLLLIGGAILLYVLWQLSGSLVAGNPKIALMILASFVAFFVAAKITRDWRAGVYYFFGWLLFEDFIRKYMGNNMTVYFAKDMLVAVVYASFLVSRLRELQKPFHPPFRFALGAFFMLGLIQFFNPLSPSFWYGALGLKLYFYYVPLMFVGYAMFQDEKDLPKFFKFNMALAGIIALIGLMQTVFGINFLNPRGGAAIDELGHMTRYNSEGQAVVRAPSVFVSEGRFQAYMMIVFVLGMGGAGYLLLRSGRKGRAIVFPGLGLTALGALMTGSRGVFIYTGASAVFLAAAMLWGAPPGKVASYRLVKAIRRSFSFIAVAVILVVAIFPAAIIPRLQFYQETLVPGGEHSEATGRMYDYPLANLKAAVDDKHALTGYGIGTASLGAQYVTYIMGVPRLDIGVEEGFGVMILEMGYLAPILWLLMGASIVVAGVKAAMKLKGTWAFPIAISIAWFAFLLLFPYTWGTLVVYQNFVVNAFFWLFMGILFKLPELVKKTQEAEPAK
jgi:hypothetical protein